jgi:hypothetical protein
LASFSATKKKQVLIKLLPEVVKKYFPGGWHLNDREERPLLILRLGQMDVKGIIKVSL